MLTARCSSTRSATLRYRVPPSVGEAAEGVGILLDGAVEGAFDGWIGEADSGGVAAAFAVAFAGCGFGAAAFFAVGFGGGAAFFFAAGLDGFAAAFFFCGVFSAYFFSWGFCFCCFWFFFFVIFYFLFLSSF